MTSLSIKLEARSAVHRCFRAYQIDVDTDLFGVWLVEMSYGRIGGLGRSKIRSFTTIEGAQAQVHACLRKRASRTTPDWCRLSRVRSYPMRAMVPARSRGSSRRLVSGAWCRFFLNLSQVQIGGTQPLMSNSVQTRSETLTTQPCAW